MRVSESIGRRREAACLLLLPLLMIGTGCDESSGDTVVVQGLDCGLVLDDLFPGDWSATFVPGTVKLQGCADSSKDGTLVNVTSTPTFYTDVQAFVSSSGASFDVVGSTAVPELSNELMASVEADSCLALVQKWESDDSGWIQCFGTFDRSNHAIPMLCDSMDLDTTVPPDGVPDVACSLDHSLTLQVLTPPRP